MDALMECVAVVAAKRSFALIGDGGVALLRRDA